MNPQERLEEVVAAIREWRADPEDPTWLDRWLKKYPELDQMKHDIFQELALRQAEYLLWLNRPCGRAWDRMIAAQQNRNKA